MQYSRGNAKITSTIITICLIIVLIFSFNLYRKNYFNGFDAMVGSCLITGTPSEAKNKTTGFTISKAAGTYTGKVSVKVKAKKGYTVYYTTGKKLTSGKKIKSKKTKTFTFTKTKTLRVYAAKKKLSD